MLTTKTLVMINASLLRDIELTVMETSTCADYPAVIGNIRRTASEYVNSDAAIKFRIDF
jgi:hypothetical protein